MCSGYHLEDPKALQGIARAAQQHPLKDRIVNKLVLLLRLIGVFMVFSFPCIVLKPYASDKSFYLIVYI